MPKKPRSFNAEDLNILADSQEAQSFLSIAKNRIS